MARGGASNWRSRRQKQLELHGIINSRDKWAIIRVQRRKQRTNTRIIDRGINLCAANGPRELVSKAFAARKARHAAGNLYISLHLCDNVKLAWRDKPVYRPWFNLSLPRKGTDRRDNYSPAI